MKQPLLVYNRIDENRRDTVIIFLLFSLLILPVAAYISHYVWALLLFSTFPSLGPGLAGLSPADHIVGTAIIAILFVSLITFLEFHFAEDLALWLTRGSIHKHEEKDRLSRTVENLCIGSGLVKPGLYIWEVPAANLFTIGLDPERARLVVSRGLLDLLDRRELEGAIAHELSHVGNYDIRLNTVAVVMEALLNFPSQVLFTPFRFLFQLHPALGIIAGIPPVCLALIICYVVVSTIEEFSFADEGVMLVLVGFGPFCYTFFIGPLLGSLLRISISRKRELLADADAILLTRNPEALGRALAKISAIPAHKTNSAISRLMIVASGQGLFSSHPPLDERMELLAGMASGQAPEIMAQDLADVDAASESITLEMEEGSGGAKAEVCNLSQAFFSGVEAGTLVIVVLSLLLTIMVWLSDGTPQQMLGIRVMFLPGTVAAVVASYRSGKRGVKVLAFGMGLGFLAGLVSNFICLPLHTPFNPDKAPVAYMLITYVNSLVEVLLGAWFGAYGVRFWPYSSKKNKQ